NKAPSTRKPFPDLIEVFAREYQFLDELKSHRPARCRRRIGCRPARPPYIAIAVPEKFFRTSRQAGEIQVGDPEYPQPSPPTAACRIPSLLWASKLGKKTPLPLPVDLTAILTATISPIFLAVPRRR